MQTVSGSIALLSGGTILLNNDTVAGSTLTVSREMSGGSSGLPGGVNASELNISVFSSASLSSGGVVTFSVYDDIEAKTISFPPFHIETSSIKRVNNMLSFSAYDSLILFDAALEDLPASAKLWELVQRACTIVGVGFDTGIKSLPNAGITITITDALQKQVKTWRDLLSWAAQIMGAYAYIKPGGSLSMRQIKGNTAVTIPADDRIQTEFSDDFTYITKLTMPRDNNTPSASVSTALTRGTRISVEFEGNPLLENYTLSSASTLLSNVLAGLSTAYMRSFNSTLFYPYAEVGDTVLLTGGNVDLEGGADGIVTSWTFALNGNCTIGCDGNSSVSTASGDSTVNPSSVKSQIDKLLIAAKTVVAQQLVAATAQIENLAATKASVEDLTATNATVANLTATKANVSDLTVAQAAITSLTVTKANVTDLTAANANIGTLQAGVANITSILAGNIGTGTLQTINLTAANSTVSTAFAKSLIASQISVGDLLAGTISTTKFNIASSSGGLNIADNTIQIRDATRVRVQIGKDASNDYNMYVWDASGNIMFDATGLKSSGIKSAIIRDDMVSAAANIDASKLNISTLFAQINGATQTITASRVYVDASAQTLDVAFNMLSNTVTAQGSTLTTQGTSLTTVQGQITSKIWQSDITTAVSGIVIGGTNLLKNSAYNGTTYWESGASAVLSVSETGVLKITPTTTTLSGVSQPASASGIVAGTKYTLSCWIKSDSARTVDWGFGGQRVRVSLTTSWQYFTITDTPTTVSGHTNVTWYSGVASTVPFYVKRAKAEIGDKATDWSPAPEDTAASITTLTDQYNTVNNTLTSHTQTIGSIQTTVAAKADSSTVTTLTSRVTAVEQDVSSYKVTVSSTYATQSTVAGINSRLTTAESSIALNADNIALKVAKDGVISAINQSAESITINAGKINLTGAVTFAAFDSAVQNRVTGAEAAASAARAVADAAQTLSANILTAGTFTYNRVTYKNVYVTADGINTILSNWCYNNNTTYIDGSNIYTGTITASKISVSDLSALNATIGGFSIGASAITSNTGSLTLAKTGTITSGTATGSKNGTVRRGIDALLQRVNRGRSYNHIQQQHNTVDVSRGG
ncbi:MAG: hypothetical protein QM689_04365 [Oscillospiraceae bacterium]